MSITAIRTGDTTFTVVGDQTVAFHTGRRVKITGDSATGYGTILTGVYTTLTTITLTAGSDTIPAAAVDMEVWYGVVSANEDDSSMPIHDHDGDEGSGGQISHADLSDNSTGADHSFIDQSVISGSSPVFDGNNFTGIDANDVNVADTNDYYTGTNVESILDEIGETRLISGFDLTTPTSLPDISFNNSTREFTVAVQGGESNFYFWVNRKKITKTTSQVSDPITNTTGTYYIYFDNSGDIQFVNQASLVPAIFYENAIVGLVYLNATAGTSMAGNEIHGKLMDGRTHHFNHSTIGARYESGLDITGLVDNTATYTNTTSGVFWDEDIRHELPLQSTHPFIYRLGATGEWSGTTADSNVGFENGTSNVVFNEWTGATWQLTESGSATDYIIYFMVATPDLSSNKVKKIIGQNGYASRSLARAAIETEMNKISMEGLPSPEFVFLNAYIVRQNGNLENLSDGSTHVDLRAVKGGTGTSAGVTSIAADVTTNTASFNTQLSATDTDVQAAFETLDDHTHVASQVSDFDIEVGNHTDVAANTAARHTESHTIVSHSDTTATGAELSILDGATLTTTELNYVDGVTSAIQTQLNAKGDMDNVSDDTDPELGGDLDLNGHYIQLDPTPDTDDTGSGEIVSMIVDVNATGVGAALHMHTDGNFEEADANAAADLPCMALALETGTGTKKVLLRGFMRNDSWNWSSIGQPVYVSTTAGGLTQTASSTTGEFVQQVGIATHADRIFFNPDYTVIEIA